MSGPKNMLGHNNGPTMEAGFAWRKHSWTKARKALLPNLPIEILRTRVKRAKSLGLPYKTYASVRAASGHDVIGFLFSNNALRVLRDGEDMPQDRMDKLKNVEAKLMSLAHAPLDPALFSQRMRAQGIEITSACAPHFSQSWSEIEAGVIAPLRADNVPRDGVLVIGDTGFEQDWSQAARLAGFLSSERYFGASA